MCPQQNQTSKGRLEYLDSLRGVGAIIVALTHLATFLPLVKDDGYLFNGVAAVSVFFVLSGYVLSLALASKRGLESFSLANFVVRRLCRIGIPFACALTIACICHQLTFRNTPSSPPFFLDYLQRWSLKTDATAFFAELLRFYSPNLLAPSWTLRPELLNSLMLPFALLLLHCRPSWFIFGFFICVIGDVLPQGGLHFGLGALLAFYQTGIVNLAKKLKITIIGPVVCLLIYVLNIQYIGPLGPYGIWAFGSVLLITALLSSPGLQSTAMQLVPRSVGRTSFSFYLLSWPMMFVLAPLAMKWVGHLQVSNLLLWLVVAAFCLGCTYLASLGFYAWCEKPSIIAGKFLGSALDRSLAPLLSSGLARSAFPSATAVRES